VPEQGRCLREVTGVPRVLKKFTAKSEEGAAKIQGAAETEAVGVLRGELLPNERSCYHIKRGRCHTAGKALNNPFIAHSLVNTHIVISSHIAFPFISFPR
jgi:hypothetical protein